jgi:hypothetical protein
MRFHDSSRRFKPPSRERRIAGSDACARASCDRERLCCRRRERHARARSRRGRSSRTFEPGSPRSGAVVGCSRSSPTPTVTSSTLRWEQSACRSRPRSLPGEIGSYKPALRHWEVFYEQTGADPPARPCAQSLYHDIAPASVSASPRSGSTGSVTGRILVEDDVNKHLGAGECSGRDHCGDQLMSSLRARCPDCRTFTAVAIDGGYGSATAAAGRSRRVSFGFHGRGVLGGSDGGRCGARDPVSGGGCR